MLLCVCSVIDHRGRQNVVRTSVTHSAAPRVSLLFVLFLDHCLSLGCINLEAVVSELLSQFHKMLI